jgi:hypothetical protein
VENQNKAKGVNKEMSELSRSRHHIEKMFNEREPDDIKIFSQCLYTIETCRVEIELREKNGTLEEFAAREGEDMEVIFYYAGLSAFQASREDNKYLESAQYYLEMLPDGWNLYKHLTLAKIYLYDSRVEDSLSQIEIYRTLVDSEEIANNLEPVELQFHSENLYMGLAAINFAKSDSTKFYEYFELYIDAIKQNNGIPADLGLLLMNFLPYLELNAANLTFLEKLLPACPYIEETLGIRYDLWINSERSNEKGNYSEALDLAIQFKASHSVFFEMSGDSFETGWKELSLRDPEGEEPDYPSENFMHPAMATYDHTPIGKLVDNRISKLSMKLEVDNQTN